MHGFVDGLSTAVEQRPSRIRQGQRAGGSLQQPHIELIFELDDLATERVRRYTQPLRSFSKTAVAYHLVEQRELVQVDHEISAIRG